jgi:hypothetical protein
MKHLSEEHLILHYYGETDASEHLDACPACSFELKRLKYTLDSLNAYEAPERGADYEALLWQRMAPEFRKKTVAWWRRPMVLAPLLSGLVVGAFFAGRISTNHRAAPTIIAANGGAANSISDAGRQRILLVALGDHLERSQMVLVELANARPEDQAGIRLSQERAQDLVAENRLYRQTAAQAGDEEFNALLDELGRVLTDIANSPSDLSSNELEQLQKRIESRGLIFKVRVVGNNLQQKGSSQL